jgi:Family of unknown function (DUF6498)
MSDSASRWSRAHGLRYSTGNRDKISGAADDFSQGVAMIRQGEGRDYSGWRRGLSLGLLVTVNLLPLYGVLAYDWDVAALVLLYWSENLVIGFYSLLKMLVASPVGGVLQGLFFCMHYGGFCAVHGLFILSLLWDADVSVLQDDSWPFLLVFIQLLVDVVRQALALAPPAALVAFAGLVLSHGVSFVSNVLLGEERQQQDLKTLMMAPYGRIVILHCTVLFGGWAVMALGQPVGMLLVLVALKLAVDVAMHLRSHRRAVRYLPYRAAVTAYR